MKTLLKMFVVLVAMSFTQLAVAREALQGVTIKDSKVSHVAPAITIVQISDDGTGFAMFLDSNGHVWHASNDGYVKFPSLEGIVKIVPDMALDKNGDVYIWESIETDNRDVEGNLISPTFSTPRKHEKLQGVTQIYEYFHYHIVVVNDQDIFGFEFASKKGFRKDGLRLPSGWPQEYGVSEPIRLGTFSKIKKVDFDVWQTNVSAQEYMTKYSMLVLDGDGRVHGYGLTPTWQASNSDETFKTLTLDHIKDIALNLEHIVVITEDGKIHFFGGCLSFGKKVQGYPLYVGGLDDESIGISDLYSVSIANGDYIRENLYLKKDGSVWASFAPFPKGIKAGECGKFISSTINNKPYQIRIGKYPAIQAIIWGSSFLILDSNHELWVRSGKFQINFKAEK